MLNYTKHNLKKLESLFEVLQYTVRYEKGNFNAGYCIVKDKKIAIINKFYDTEGRINCLLDILQTVEVDDSLLEEKSLKFYRQVMKAMEMVKEEGEE